MPATVPLCSLAKHAWRLCMLLVPDTISHICLDRPQLYTFPVLDMIEIGLVKRGIPNGWITRLIYRCSHTTCRPAVPSIRESVLSLVGFPVLRCAPAACLPPPIQPWWPVASMACSRGQHHPPCSLCPAFVQGSPAALSDMRPASGAGPLPTLALAFMFVLGALKLGQLHDF